MKVKTISNVFLIMQNYRKMRNLLIVLLLFCCPMVPLAAQTITGKVIDKDSVPIAGVDCILANPLDSIPVVGTTTDLNGMFELKASKGQEYVLLISFLGFETYSAQIILDEAMDLGTITLKEKAHTLDDVVITAEMVDRFSDRKEYKLTNADKEQYSSALSALEFLPKIQVIDQSVSSVDGKGVKILINGVPSTATDLSIISPSNIAKIDYYTQPPVQYSNMGLGAVINVVTKTNENGGIIGLNTQNAVTTGFGNNTVNFKYNFGNSQVGVTYNINYRNYNKRILDESLRYLIDDEEYRKEKTGKDSPYAYEEQMAEISFNNAKADNYVFSTKLSLKSLNRRRSSVQDIMMYSAEETTQLIGESSDKDKYIRPVLDMYFNKSFNKKHEITLNAVGTYYDSDYKYNYRELLGDITDFETATDISTDKYSFIGDAVYSLNLKSSQLFVGTRYMYNNNRQKNIAGPNSIETNEVYSYVGATGMIGQNVNYNVSVGVNHNVFATLGNERYSFTYFRPQLSVGYFIDETSDVMLNYEVNTQTPSISNLTYNPYYKDPHYVYVGNPDLKPGNIHNVSLSYYKGFKKFVINPEIGYSYAQDAIVPVFIRSDKDIAETFGNIDYVHNMTASLFLQWYPFDNNLLRLRLFADVYHQINKYGEMQWEHTGFSIIPSIMMSYKKWGLQLYYQTKKETLSGQMLKVSPSMAYAELSFRPLKNMTVTAGIRYPFYDAWKLTTKTYGTNLISRVETERIINNANMVYLNFVYNFSFGKNKPNVKLKMSNEDKDTGILGR